MTGYTKHKTTSGIGDRISFAMCEALIMSLVFAGLFLLVIS